MTASFFICTCNISIFEGLSDVAHRLERREITDSSGNDVSTDARRAHHFLLGCCQLVSVAPQHVHLGACGTPQKLPKSSYFLQPSNLALFTSGHEIFCRFETESSVSSSDHHHLPVHTRFFPGSPETFMNTHISPNTYMNFFSSSHPIFE